MNKPSIMLFLILWIGIFVAISFGQGASITKAPEPKNVTANGEVFFICRGIASIFSWKINNHFVDYEEHTVPINANENFRQSTLKWIANSSDNNSIVSCIAIILDPFTQDESDPALLLVQDVLKPVTDITLSSVNSTTVLISWSPPSTLVGVPILGYNVTITNTVTGENVQNFSTDVPSVQYSPAQNDNYLITIVAMNKAGSGLPAYYLDVLPLPTMNSIDHTSTTSHSDSTSILFSSSTVFPTMPSPNGNESKIGPLTIVLIVAVFFGAIGTILIAVLALVMVMVAHKETKLYDELKEMEDLSLDNAIDVSNVCQSSSQPSTQPRPPETDKCYAHKNDNLKDDDHKDDSGVGTTLVTDPPSESTHDNAKPVVDHHMYLQVEEVSRQASRKEVVTTCTTDPKEHSTVPGIDIVDGSPPEPVVSTSAIPVSDEEGGCTAMPFVPSSKPMVITRATDLKELSPSPDSDDDGNPPEPVVSTSAIPVSDEGGGCTAMSFVSSSKPVDPRNTVISRKVGGFMYHDPNKRPALKDITNCLDEDSDFVVDAIDEKGKSSEEMVGSTVRPPETSRDPLSDTVAEHVLSTKTHKYEHQSDRPEWRSMSPDILPAPELPDNATHDERIDSFGGGAVGYKKGEAEVPSSDDIDQISHQVAHKWRLIGQQIGASPAELNQIASECGSDQSLCCYELFRKWSARKITASCPFTWEKVIEIILLD